MAGGRLGGNGNTMQRGIWIFLSCCIVVALLGAFPNSPKGVMNTLEEKSEGLRNVAATAKQWVDGAVSHFNSDQPAAPKNTERESSKTGSRDRQSTENDDSTVDNADTTPGANRSGDSTD